MTSKSGELASATFQNNGGLDSEAKVDLDGANGAHPPIENEVQGFGPSVSVWQQLNKTSRSRVIIAGVLTGIIGIALGAGITIGIFIHVVNKDDGPSQTTLIRLQLNTTAQSREEKVFTPVNVTEVNCIGVVYGGKCFRAFVKEGMTIHLNESKELCEEAGLRLANVYTPSHYYMIEGYLRDNFPASKYISAWTGMTMNPDNHQIILSTGDFITLENIPWHRGYPNHEPKYTHMGIDVRKMPTKDDVDRQGLWNYDPSWFGNAAICEDF